MAAPPGGSWTGKTINPVYKQYSTSPQATPQSSQAQQTTQSQPPIGSISIPPNPLQGPPMSPQRPQVQGPIISGLMPPGMSAIRDGSAHPAPVSEPVNMYQSFMSGEYGKENPNWYYQFRAPNAGLAGSGTYGKPLYGGYNIRYGENWHAQTDDPREWLYGGRMNPGQESPWGPTSLMGDKQRRLVEAVMNRAYVMPKRFAGQGNTGTPRMAAMNSKQTTEQ